MKLGKKTLSLLFGLIALVVGVSIGLNTRHHIGHYPLSGQIYDTPEGERLDLGTLKGQAVILNFWAPWCAPCIEEMPALNAWHRENPQVRLIGIAIDKAENVKAFQQKTPVDYPIVLGGLSGTELSKSLGNQQGGLPFTVILNAEGKKILTKTGKIEVNEIDNALNR